MKVTVLNGLLSEGVPALHSPGLARVHMCDRMTHPHCVVVILLLKPFRTQNPHYHYLCAIAVTVPVTFLPIQHRRLREICRYMCGG